MMVNIKNSTFQDFETMTEDEILDTFGGGGLSDLVVRGLTYIGDHVQVGPWGNLYWK